MVFMKKVQSQRFALQELLMQFLLVYHYCTSNFLFRKKVQSQRFALQELLMQFLEVYHYCTSNFLFRKKAECTLTAKHSAFYFLFYNTVNY